MRVPTGKLIASLVAALALAGCASIAPPEPPSLELPRPPADLHATRKGDKVTVSWTIPARTTDHRNVRYLGKTKVCRSFDRTLVECGPPVAEVDRPADFAANAENRKKLTATYSGSISSGLQLNARPGDPFGTITYAVEVLNEDDRSAGLSNQVHVSLAETLPAPADFAAHLTGQGVVLTWTGELLSVTGPQPVRYSYRIFRRQEGSTQQVLVGEVAAGTNRDLSFTDSGMEWEKTSFYHADSLTVVTQPGQPEVSIEGDDTPEIKIFAHDVFPPAVPSGLQAAFSGPGQQAFIDLVWSPVADADLAGYNIYRHEEGGAPVKINSALVGTPSFRDADVVAGKKYVYSVSAVDQRGNESARSEEASENMP